MTSTLHLSLGLARRGVRVRFVCPPDSEVEALARAGGLEVHPIPLLPHETRANADTLAAFLARYPVDLINSQSARDREALTWLGLRARLAAPVVLTRRQMPRTTFLSNWLASRCATRVIAVSRAVGEALVRRGTPRRKLTVVPNGLVPGRVDRPVADSEREAWRARLGPADGRPVIGVVARPKDHRVLLRALDRLRTPVHLVFAGIDPASALGGAAAAVAPPHTVTCIRFTPDVRPLYNLLDLVLLPSRSEGLSQALLEAMALEKPVIASHAGGNPELIEHDRSGLLVPPLDPAAWAAAIDGLLCDHGRRERLAAAGRHRVRETFSLERTVETTLRLYGEIVS